MWRTITCFLVIRTFLLQNPIHSSDLFHIYSVIACKPAFPTYLAALNPTDQVFDFEELEYHYQVANRTEDAPSKEVDDDDEDGDGDEMMMKPEKGEKESNHPDDTAAATTNATTAAILDQQQQTTTLVDAVNAATTLNNSPTIDNPYLRAAKVPKRIKQDSMTMMTMPSTQ